MTIGNEIDNDPTLLIAQIQALAPRLKNQDDQEARKECLRLSKAITAQVEEPDNVAVSLAFSPVIALTARIAVDLNLFALVVEHGPVTSASLATLAGGEELLINRILRLLSTVHLVAETDARTWSATRITKAMAREEIAAGHRFNSHLVVPAMQSAPSFFQQHGYASPTNTKKGLVQHALQTDQTTFEYIVSHPSVLKDFNAFMGNAMGARKSWLSWYPVHQQIITGADPSTALIVDVGGGKGHDLIAFHQQFPHAGRLVVEDLPAVLEPLGEFSAVIEQVGHDFFSGQQPVKGARAYLCHHIMHDWPDSYCLRILEGIVSAMTPGYSKLLLHEIIVPEQGASEFQAESDIAAMVCNGGMERTKKQWYALLQAAGLEVVKIWESAEEGGDGIVEARWPETPPSYTHFLSATLLASLIYLILTRLVFHRLARVPGPPLAALTGWYEFYYDVVHDGEYLKQIEQMHATYKSSIIRTGPNQVHVNDPEVYKTTFASGSPFNKSEFFYSSVGVGDAIGAMTDRKRHHIRRALLSLPLRPQAVLAYSPSLHQLVMYCADVMAGQARKGRYINLLRYARALTVDVIAEFTFGRPMGLVNEEDAMPDLIRDLQGFSSQFHWFKHFPVYRRLLAVIPPAVAQMWMPEFFQLREKATVAVNEYLVEKKKKKVTDSSNNPNQDPKDGTFLDLLLNPPLKITSEAPSPSVLIDEGCAFITGGSDTTGFTLENATYCLLRYPHCLQTLRQELDAASPYIRDSFNLPHVLQLPFLSAVIKETLRLFTPAAGPLPRTVPEKGVVVDGHYLPEGAILTHSLHLIHHNPEVFDSPKSFRPERWLGARGKELEQYYVPFSRGSRSCIGMALAYHEIYTYLAVMFSRFDMELFDMVDGDMDWCDHFFVKRKGVMKMRIVRDRWSGEEFSY
ncbi:hypothetical protein FE257_010064 [Aspergillus nanangensis]|uniref:O-methyltransferase C-terminal domain-containing protein n=1 Tax=Aspergillus nanangensis TaxID=2582783 RepID=A0AAD4GXJ9_ASPNN|nr:hypothetical protein FE257_010064 [Aspergillus nanangensis]